MIELQVKHSPDSEPGKPSDTRHSLHSPDSPPQVVFEGDETWRRNRPSALVVACSDGRLQKSIDEFLALRLGIVDYDRLYAPGGPGALGSDYGDHHTDQLNRELEFLMRAHKIEEIILLFHGADKTGPEDAVCAHYRRVMPQASRAEIVHEQYRHAADAISIVAKYAPRVKVHVFRAEVSANSTVKFVDMRRR